MKILVVGRGGREHAIVQKLARDGGAEICAAPGNVGMVEATLVPISDDDVAALADFAEQAGVDLTIVGPEHALVAGIADEFAARGLRVFGPTAAGARLEGSKHFAKAMMARHDVPTADYAEFTEVGAALAHVRERGLPLVVKADGLAAGKGVVIPATLDEAEQAVTAMLSGEAFGAAGRKVVIEEFLEGEEFSLMSFVSGLNYAPMPVARDYKRAHDGDSGLNTGGMGANSPHPLISPADYAEALEQVVEPMLRGMAAEGIEFTGVLYAGLMKTAAGVKVIEFNVRFGDPETEVVLPRLVTPLVDVIDAVTGPSDAGAGAGAGASASGGARVAVTARAAGGAGAAANRLEAQWSDQATVGVVLAARGYPGTPVKGAPISGLDIVAGGLSRHRSAGAPDGVSTGVSVLHMGTTLEAGQVVTNGGRVLCVVAAGADLRAARANAYLGVAQIQCPDLFHRTDIAAAVA